MIIVSVSCRLSDSDSVREPLCRAGSERNFAYAEVMLVSFVASLAVYLRRKCAIRRMYVEDPVPEAVLLYTTFACAAIATQNSLTPSDRDFHWILRFSHYDTW